VRGKNEGIRRKEKKKVTKEVDDLSDIGKMGDMD